MKKALLLAALLLATIGSSLYASDPIVGCWGMDREFGSYKFNMLVDEDGSVVTELLGDVMEGQWTKREDETYRITPSAEDDYYRASDTTLSSYDQEGLIRTFSRTPCE